MNDQQGTTQKELPTWADIQPKKEQIKWQVDECHTVVFLEDEPKKVEHENGEFYVFDVQESQKDKVIATSSMSLLRGLKAHSPLAGKALKICKKTKNGKQFYAVEQYSERDDLA